MKVEVFGKILDLKIPLECLQAVYKPKEVKPLKNVEKVVKERLRNPIKSDSIQDLAKKGKKVVVIVDTWHRMTPVYQILPSILDEILMCGVEKDDILIVMAHGVHASLTEENMIQKKLSRKVYSRFKVFEHTRFDKNVKFDFVGFSSFGNPIWVNRTVAKANIKIGVGGIGLNPISGYSGGGKIILPGVADYYSSCLNHKMSLAENPRYGEVNHPTRKEMDEVVEMIGLDVIVNVLLNSNGVITDIFVGHPVEAYENGVKTYQKQNEPLKEVKKADLTLMVQTSPTKPEIVPAYPPNFFSAMDAIIKAGMLTNEDGFIILDYECLSGFFHKNCPSCKVCQAYILNAAKSKSSTDVLQMVSREKIRGWIGPLIYWMSKVKEKIRRFVWVNSLIDKDLKKMNYDVEKNVSKALTKILRDNKK